MECKFRSISLSFTAGIESSEEPELLCAACIENQGGRRLAHKESGDRMSDDSPNFMTLHLIRT